ncbi:hypothetical protein ACIA5G_33705 [Amycolatopsis sp. NPDC051758]|uniref:hypothetical protein n=1 Tax=Amycolatopsis sp. NPDC051758 TaxID=3363935 RepID=UPI00378D129C
MADSTGGTADLIARWITTGKSTRTSPPVQVNDGLRFAFYGRTSTFRHQDRVSSQGWQRDMADNLISGHGQKPREHGRHR